MDVLGAVDCNSEDVFLIWCSSFSERGFFFDGVRSVIASCKSDFIAYEGYYDSGGVVYESFFDNPFKFEEELIVCLNSEGVVVGFFCFEPYSSREDVPVDDDSFAYLSLAMVREEYRGFGIGQSVSSRLFKLLDSEFGCTRVYFSTWEGNETQLYVYGEKFGFDIVARKEEHRSNGDDTVYLGQDVQSVV